jgi:hypothetical protein
MAIRKSLFGPMMSAAVLVIAFGFTNAQAGEKKQLTWTTTWGEPKEVAVLSLSDVPDHVLYQYKREDTITSPDPEWNNTKWVVYERGDEIAGDGAVQGYATDTFANGDLAYLAVQGAYTGSYTESEAWIGTAQGFVRYIGGTGKYLNITGAAAFHCEGKDVMASEEEGAAGGCTFEGEIAY